MNEAPADAGTFMATEIAEQPARWLSAVGEQRGSIERAAAVISSWNPELVVLGARGSSLHAALYGQTLVQEHMSRPAMLSTMSTVTMFGAGVRYPRSVFVAISQSGRSPDLIDTTRSMRDAGLPVVALTNDPTSELAVEADVHIDLCAGPERSVAATKTFTAELVALYLLVGTSVGRSWTTLEREVSRTSALVAARLSKSCPAELDAASVVATEDKLLVVGRGYSFSTAKETALKIMETSAVAASGWSSAEALHGPIGQVETGTPVIAFTSDRRARESVGALVSKVAELGARLITVGPDPIPGTSQASTSGQVSITVDRAPDAALQPLIDVVVGQRLALEVSLRRGMDPDRPAALTKVTRTL